MADWKDSKSFISIPVNAESFFIKLGDAVMRSSPRREGARLCIKKKADRSSRIEAQGAAYFIENRL